MQLKNLESSDILFLLGEYLLPYFVSYVLGLVEK